MLNEDERDLSKKKQLNNKETLEGSVIATLFKKNTYDSKVRIN